MRLSRRPLTFFPWLQPNAGDLYSFDADFEDLKQEILRTHNPSALKDVVQRFRKVIRKTHVVPNSATGEVVQMAPTSIIRTRNKKSSQAKKAATAGKRKRTRDPIAAEIAEQEIKTSVAKEKRRSGRACSNKAKIAEQEIKMSVAKVKRRSRRACSNKTRISSGKSTPQSLPSLFTGDIDLDYAPEPEEAGSEASLEPDAEYEEAASDSSLETDAEEAGTESSLESDPKEAASESSLEYLDTVSCLFLTMDSWFKSDQSA